MYLPLQQAHQQLTTILIDLRKGSVDAKLDFCDAFSDSFRVFIPTSVSEHVASLIYGRLAYNKPSGLKFRGASLHSGLQPLTRRSAWSFRAKTFPIRQGSRHTIRAFGQEFFEDFQIGEGGVITLTLPPLLDLSHRWSFITGLQSVWIKCASRSTRMNSRTKASRIGCPCPRNSPLSQTSSTWYRPLVKREVENLKFLAMETSPCPDRGAGITMHHLQAYAQQPSCLV